MKNLIIAVLAIGLAVSGYFNWKDSKMFKIDPEKETLRITFSGTLKQKDSLVPKKDNIAPLEPKSLNFSGDFCSDPKVMMCAKEGPGTGDNIIPAELLLGNYNIGIANIKVVNSLQPIGR